MKVIRIIKESKRGILMNLDNVVIGTS